MSQNKTNNNNIFIAKVNIEALPSWSGDKILVKIGVLIIPTIAPSQLPIEKLKNDFNSDLFFILIPFPGI